MVTRRAFLSGFGLASPAAAAAVSAGFGSRAEGATVRSWHGERHGPDCEPASKTGGLPLTEPPGQRAKPHGRLILG